MNDPKEETTEYDGLPGLPIFNVTYCMAMAPLSLSLPTGPSSRATNPNRKILTCLGVSPFVQFVLPLWLYKCYIDVGRPQPGSSCEGQSAVMPVDIF